MKSKRINEFKGVFVTAIGLIVLASLLSFDRNDLSFYTSSPNAPPHNWISTFGAYLAGLLLYLFGWASFLLPIFILWMGVKLFLSEPPDIRWPRLAGIILFLLSVGSLLGLMYLDNQPLAMPRAGFFGFIFSKIINQYFGRLGGFISFIALALLSLGLVTEVLISTFLRNIGVKSQNLLAGIFHKRDKSFSLSGGNGQSRAKLQESRVKPRFPNLNDDEKDTKQEDELARPLPIGKPKVRIKENELLAEAEPKTKPQQPLKIGDYRLPGLELLNSPPSLEARQIKEDLTHNARVLEETLEDFGIAVKVTDIERGPIITRYELEPAPGVKINRIVTLSDDIALAMKAQSVRIVAPIPGKARVGVEVPNTTSTLVFFKEIVSSKEFLESDSKLTIALGKDISGTAVIAHLDDMPHMLIAGTTGSGKTVCVNSVILSLLMRCTPNELKFVMVDPKMVELAPFNGLPHLLCPVVTDSKKAAGVLNWVVNEMERRYKLLAEFSARNIRGYNEKNKEQPLPYIVVIIDEFADLMVVARDQVESAVTRLAQLSRAVGIHLVLATQRPSVDVITGVIKANMPARLSFKVASKVDSRTVLDMNGADKLLGRGDMLFLRPQDAKLTRAQGALVDDIEIERVVDFIKAQAAPVYNEEISKDQQKSGIVNGERDELYDEAVRIIIESNQASVSILQRRLRLGYTRAARIIDMMEEDGMVGPFEGSKPRRLLVDREEWLKKDMMQEKNV
ncbi:MAG: DNA translocase FtsK [Candidatus Omnitrophota bacterium]